VVIVDQKMPGMSGTEMAGTRRYREFTGPMILLSASIDSQTNSECLRLGIHALSKLSHGAIFHTLELFRQDVNSRGDQVRGAIQLPEFRALTTRAASCASSPVIMPAPWKAVAFTCGAARTSPNMTTANCCS
jgi:CheY-like chemotaxis protein